jgi:hypothetical protein
MEGGWGRGAYDEAGEKKTRQREGGYVKEWVGIKRAE